MGLVGMGWLWVDYIGLVGMSCSEMSYRISDTYVQSCAIVNILVVAVLRQSFGAYRVSARLGRSIP